VEEVKILIACEESQIVCKAFRDRGHEAYSCDILPTRGNPFWHFRQDITKLLDSYQDDYWDLVILHPDCTKMAVSGNRWYGRGTPGHQERQEAIEWTITLWELAVNKSKSTCLENPISVIFKYLAYQKLQYIQPWMFGHGETKKTGLALFNLPELEPTNMVEGREQRIWKMPPGENRKRDRSETFQGIADAFAEQWG